MSESSSSPATSSSGRLLEEAADMITEESAMHAQACRHAAVDAALVDAIRTIITSWEHKNESEHCQMLAAIDAALGEHATSLPSATEQSADAERYRFMRAKLCNRESLEFDRFPSSLNLAGLASIKPSEIDAAVDAMREEK